MSVFLRLLADENKQTGLATLCRLYSMGIANDNIFEVAVQEFDKIAGSPFAYWVSERIRNDFGLLPRFESEGRFVKHGLTTGDDTRFLRAWWEISKDFENWLPFAKGGTHSPFYYDQVLVLKWTKNGAELESGSQTKCIPGTRMDGCRYFRRPGLTWPLRARRFSPQVLPSGSSFSARRYCAFTPESETLFTLAVFNSSAFDYIFKTALGRYGYPEFIVGTLQILPWPEVQPDTVKKLGELAYCAWKASRGRDHTNEVSHAFNAPQLLFARGNNCYSINTEEAMDGILTQINNICFDLFDFDQSDRVAALKPQRIRAQPRSMRRRTKVGVETRKSR